MITKDEYREHRSHTLAPIRDSWIKKKLNGLKKLDKGTLIWVDVEYERDFPVAFISLDRHEHFTNITYESIVNGQAYRNSVYYYTFIRKVTDKEKAEILKELSDKIKILNIQNEVIGQ